jgi:quinol monooxygenase YgiN
VGSAKNLAWRLWEAWRNAHLNAQHIQQWRDARIQIRFQPP